MLSEEDKMLTDYKEKAKPFNSYVGSVVSKKKICLSLENYEEQEEGQE